VTVTVCEKTDIIENNNENNRVVNFFIILKSVS